MSNEHLTPKQAIEFLNDEEAIFYGRVAQGKLQPCFLCNVTLIDVGIIDYDFYIHGEDNTVRGYLQVNGYITTSENENIASLLASQEPQTFYLRRAKVVENLLEIKDFYDLDEFILAAVDKSKSYEISIDSANYVKDRGIKFNIKDCIFYKSDLIKILHELQSSQIKSTLNSHELVSKKDAFEPAILKALEQLGIDPKAMPPYNNKQKHGVRHQVIELLKANPETKYLTDSLETFNSYWQGLRKRKVLIEKN